ncbi:MAG: magnesium transporter [Epsilonproteobacteria bacterium]|nr:magnesium transporter [Campylobacterota bacterium]
MKFEINGYLIDDIENKDHPSDFEIAKEYSVLILRLPYIKDEAVEVISYAFLIKDEVYLYNREKEDFEKLGDFSKLHEFLDVRVDKILAKLNSFHSQIAKLEDDLYDQNIDKEFANIWLGLKKELVLIERLMEYALIAFERFMRHYRLDGFDFKDLREHFERSRQYAKSAIEKLDYLYEFFKAKQDEKMNKIMFVLTILSGVFLPLTLVTGFFGMNTGGLPWVGDSFGTLKAAVVGVVLEVPVIYMLWRMMK